MHEAAAIITFLAPGLRFFHQGQLEGRTQRISPHLVRAPEEPINQRLAQFYERLLTVLRQPSVRDGCWQLLECRAAWEGNWTNDCFIAFSWTGTDNSRWLLVVNYADHPSQCSLTMPWSDFAGRGWCLRDRMGTNLYERDGEELATRGLYLDLPAWAYHVFDLHPL